MTLIRESAELNRRERDKVEYLTPGSPVNYSLLSTGVIAGDSIKVINGGTATVTVLSSNASTITSLLPGTDATFVALVSSPTTAANFKAVLTAMDPTALSDAAATRMGLKVYSHGVTYTGSPNSPTITLGAGGGSISSVALSSFIPYQLQSGAWRMKFTIVLNVNVFGRANLPVIVAGITYASTYQFGCGGTTDTFTFAVYTEPSTSQLQIVGSATAGFYSMSFDVLLASKPTWAY